MSGCGEYGCLGFLPGRTVEEGTSESLGTAEQSRCRGFHACVPQKLVVPLPESILQLRVKKQTLREKGRLTDALRPLHHPLPATTTTTTAAAATENALSSFSSSSPSSSSNNNDNNNNAGGRGEGGAPPPPPAAPEHLKFGFVACGERHTLAITANWTDYKGRLFSWGDGGSGRLGHGSEDDGFVPQQIVTFKDRPSLPQTLKMGKKSGAGVGGVGRASNSRPSAPQTAFEAIKFVAAGMAHSAAISQSGKLFTWGDGGEGRLGHRTGDRAEWVPRRVTEWEDRQGHDEWVPMKRVACGQRHTVAVSDGDGLVYAWGYGKDGQLGNSFGGASSVKMPAPVQFFLKNRINAVTVVAGESHSLCVSDDNEMYVWGSNLCGQLGPSQGKIKDYQPRKIDLGPEFEKLVDSNGIDSVKVSCGSVGHSCTVVSCRVVAKQPASNQDACPREVSRSRLSFKRNLAVPTSTSRLQFLDPYTGYPLDRIMVDLAAKKSKAATAIVVAAAREKEEKNSALLQPKSDRGQFSMGESEVGTEEDQNKTRQGQDCQLVVDRVEDEDGTLKEKTQQEGILQVTDKYDFYFQTLSAYQPVIYSEKCKNAHGKMNKRPGSARSMLSTNRPGSAPFSLQKHWQRKAGTTGTVCETTITEDKSNALKGKNGIPDHDKSRYFRRAIHRPFSASYLKSKPNLWARTELDGLRAGYGDFPTIVPSDATQKWIEHRIELTKQRCGEEGKSQKATCGLTFTKASRFGSERGASQQGASDPSASNMASSHGKPSTSETDNERGRICLVTTCEREPQASKMKKKVDRTSRSTQFSTFGNASRLSQSDADTIERRPGESVTPISRPPPEQKSSKQSFATAQRFRIHISSKSDSSPGPGAYEPKALHLSATTNSPAFSFGDAVKM
jgi:hypothetical protein